MSLTPVSNNNINYNNILNAIPQLSNSNGALKQESAVKPDKEKSHFIQIAAAIALSAAAIAGIAIAAGKNKIPTEVSSTLKAYEELQTATNGITKEVMAFSESIREKFNSVCALYKNNGVNADGSAVAKITKAKDDVTTAIMEEFNPDGSLFRRSSFTATNTPAKIEEFLEGGKKNILEYDWFEGLCAKYTEGEKILPDGQITIDRQLQTGKNFQPETYMENCIKTQDTYTVGINAKFNNGMLAQLYKNYSLINEKDLSVGEALVYKGGKVDMYVQNDKITNGLETVERELDFKDGKPAQCIIESKEISEGNVVFRENFTYNDSTGKWLESKS